MEKCMPKTFSIDYSNLEGKIYKKAYKFEDVKNHLETVAFDVVRFKDGDKGANLWQVQNSDDGDYIVALYQPDEEKTACVWDVVINKIAGNLQISYKGDPLVKIACSKLGIPRNELEKVKEYLPTKLSGNKKLVKAMLNELPYLSRQEVLKKYPELI